MNPTSIASFRSQSLCVQYSAHGVSVAFRAAAIIVLLSVVRVSLDMDMGGISAGGEYTCRFLASSLSTPPQRGEQVAFNGRRYTIKELKDTISTPGEFVCVIQPGGKTA